MGTFDILNMRVNGYQYHIELMDGAQKWTDPKIAAVFDAWKELLPFNGDSSAPLGRTWQDAANLLVQKKAGMYFLGTFAGQQATEPPTTTTSTSSRSRRSAPSSTASSASTRRSTASC